MRRLVLAGAGHAHVQVLADWLRAPVPGVELVLVSPGRLALYSGMVPGWLAGVYRFDEICIRVGELAVAAGARLIVDELAGLDPARRCLRLRSGALLGYDLLSLNVGSTLRPPSGAGARVLPLRPLGELRQRWETLLGEPDHARPFSVTAVGGGAAGVEALLAVLARLRRLQPGRTVRACLVTRAPALLPGMAPGAVPLALLATADGRAVASWGRWSAQGRWAWRWKDRVDRGFVRRFNDAAAAP